MRVCVCAEQGHEMTMISMTISRRKKGEKGGAIIS